MQKNSFLWRRYVATSQPYDHSNHQLLTPMDHPDGQTKNQNVGSDLKAESIKLRELGDTRIILLL